MQDGNLHCHVGNVSRLRSDGRERSAVAAAAYVSGTSLWNEREQKITSFCGRADVKFSAIFAPDGAPAWVTDREKLWNSVEAHLKRRDARLAKTIEVAITRDIPREQWPEMLRQLVGPYVKAGMVADAAIHDDGTNHNPHIHVLLTVNELKPDGFGKKLPNVEHKSFVTRARTGWETITNKFLAANGSGIRVDARSYKARGVQQQPTQHRGPNQQERRARRAIAKEHSRKETVMSRTPDDRKAAEEAAQQQFEENRVGEWFESKQDEVRLRQEQRASGETPWYEQARERVRDGQIAQDDPSGETRRIDEELAERRAAYERDVWRRAVNSPRTREEHELLHAAKDAPPELRRKIETEILSQRMHNIRVRDDAERLAQLEQDMQPSLRERFEAFVTREREVDHYPEPEPGPNYAPHSPAELDRARERARKEYEREEQNQER